VTAGPHLSETGANCGQEPRFVSVGGIRTRYYDVGSGEVVVLCHGAGWSGATSANTWAPVLAPLGRDFRVVAPDRLGSGMTDGPPDPTGFTIEAQVQHFYEFLRTLGIERAHLIGQSRGGYIVTRLALEHPELAHTLIVIDTSTLAPDVGDLDERRSNLFAPAPEDRRERHRFRLAQMSHDPSHLTDEFIDAALMMDELPQSQTTKRLWRNGGEAHFNTSLEQQKQETLAWLEQGRLKLPLLIYWARNDPSALLEQAYRLFELVGSRNSNARLYVTNGAGHFHYREQPREFCRIVSEFIAAWRFFELFRQPEG
jgi:2-hydroxy-6-oxonona-2,4-dienedioate hydrolase